MYTQDKVSKRPSYSALKRQRAALKRALRKQERIERLITENANYAARLNELRYQNR
jgi:hypothetical protein